MQIIPSNIPGKSLISSIERQVRRPIFFATDLLQKSLVKAAPLVPSRVRYALLCRDYLPNDTAVKMRKLPNGLTYYLRHNTYPAKGVASLRLVVNVGSVDELDEEQGMAHLVEHCVCNETASYSQQDLKSFLLSVGCSDGEDSNASTTQTSTKYYLDLPLHDPEKLEKAIHIFSEMASKATFSQDLVNKERGAVLDEIRVRKSAKQEFGEEISKILDEGTRYPERFPCGKEEVVKSCSADDLKNFYKKWYKPQNMALVLVGDIDGLPTEKWIKQYFGSIPKSENPPARPAQKAKDYGDEARVFVFKHSEQTESLVGLFEKLPTWSQKGLWSKAVQKVDLVASCAINMLNQRLNEVVSQKECPFQAADVDTTDSHGVSYFVAGAKAWEGRGPEALKALNTEVERIRKHGFTKEEFEDVKADLMESARWLYNERDKMPTKGKVSQCIDNFLAGTPYPSTGDRQRKRLEILQQLNVDEVNHLVKQVPSGQNVLVWGRTFPKDSVSADDLMSAVTDDRVTDLQPYRPAQKKPLMATLPTGGKIESEEYIPAVDATVWRLENGLQVFVKKTDFDADAIDFYALAPGGFMHLSLEEYLKTGAAEGIASQCGLGDLNDGELTRALSGTGAQLSLDVEDSERKMGGSSSKEGLETLMQLIHLSMTQPRIDKDAFDQSYQRRLENARNFTNNPRLKFFDAVNDFIFNHHPVARHLKEGELKKLDYDACVHARQRWFGSPEEFSMVFSGNIDQEKLKVLVERYLAGIPAQGHSFPRKIEEEPFPKGITRSFVMEDVNETTTVINFPSRIERGPMMGAKVTCLCNILEDRITKRLRGEMGDTYTPVCDYFGGFDFDSKPDKKVHMRVNFTAEPEKQKELEKATFDEVKRLLKEGITLDELDGQKKIRRHGLQKGMESNAFWSGVIADFSALEYDFSRFQEYLELVDHFTIEEANDLLRRLINLKQYNVATLKPKRG